MRFLPVALVLAFVALSPLEARAHLGLEAPTSRYGPDVLKTGPCGVAGGERTDKVTYYEPGETIDVYWDEYVQHPGHFRIAFDDDGVDDFVDPATMMELYSNDTVLLDGIEDKGPGERSYMETVTLPDVTCENCTLQVIQVMYDKPEYTTPGNDIYYQCADLVLRSGGAPPGPDAGTDAGTDPGADPGAGGGCGVAHGPASGLEVMPMFLILFACRLARRRRFPV
jgi:hypothetical protein